jgi:hypothetical protein
MINFIGMLDIADVQVGVKRILTKRSRSRHRRVLLVECKRGISA